MIQVGSILANKMNPEYTANISEINRQDITGKTVNNNIAARSFGFLSAQINSIVQPIINEEAICIANL